jgi:hypothetical protein
MTSTPVPNCTTGDSTRMPHQQADEPQQKRRVLFLSLEFVDPIFSGNGILSRGTVAALRAHGNCSVLVLCARPAGEIIHQTAAVAPSPPNTTAATNAQTSPGASSDEEENHTKAQQQTAAHVERELDPLCVIVSKWYKLDRDSAWEGWYNFTLGKHEI